MALSGVVVSLVLAQPASALSVARWRSEIVVAAQTFKLPEGWIRAVMIEESGGHTTQNGKPLRSKKGAIGLMQLMPATWRDLRNQLGLGANPDDPHDNIMAGAAYLRRLYDRFGYPGLFIAYNAGPNAYVRSLKGAPLSSETRAYVARIERDLDADIADRSRLFIESDASSKPVTADGLFVRLREPSEGGG